MPLDQRQQVMAGLDAAKNFDLGAYQAQYQKAQADQAAALKAAQATGLSDQYTQLYGGADIIPGMTQGILSNLGIQNPYLPVYSLVGSESVGNNLANERMQFAPIPGVDYRLTDKNTGQVTTASTPEEIKALIGQSNALSAAGGKKANLAIESNQAGNWSPVFEDEPNPVMNTITKLALAGMIGATGAGLLQPGGLGGLGAGASGAGGAGAGLGTTASLAPGALSSLPANLAAIQAGANTALAGAGLGAGAAGLGAGAAGLGGSSGAASLGAGAAGIEALAPITVTATGSNFVLPSIAALTAATALPSLTGLSTPGAAPTDLMKNEFGSNVTPEGEIVATGSTPTNLLPAALGVGTVGGAIALSDLLSNAAAANATGATTSASDLAASRTTPTAAETAALNAGAGGGGVFGTGLTPGQAALIGTTALNAVSNLTDGGSNKTVQTPGTGSQALNPIFSAQLPTPGAGGFKVGGLDYVTPPARSAADMYRYAMGPAMDIPAGVNLARATSPYAGFGPGTLGQETFNRITAGAGPEVYGRQPGFTGVTSNQTLGDTQVVDGTTWVWGGDKRGWEMQYTDPATGQKRTLPGNGATNVSSFANNPTVQVNQPYFKQNLTNIPDWAQTYQGWQRAMMGAGVPQDVRFAAEREFMDALEKRPFANATELVNFAQDLYQRSAQPRKAAHGGSMGYARGSSRESFAVEGPGTGRSDDIPAVLSDGEYVIDAETVALLGDGSSKAGAKRLDELRVNLRKHKGRNLAKGKFSVNAKRPEKYLSGGRT